MPCSLLLMGIGPQALAKPAARGGGSVYLTTPNPTTPIEHNNRAVELGSKGLWDQAIQEHEIALDGAPDVEMFRRNLSSAHLRYADILAGKKNYTAAIQHYRSALYVDPNNGQADYSLDRCLQALGKSAGDPGYRQSLAESAERTPGHFTEAVVEYRKCTKLQENSGPAYFRLGRCLLRGNRDQDIVSGYKELLTAVRKSWGENEQDQLVECHLLIADTLKDFAYKAKNYADRTKYVKRLNNSAVEYRRAATIAPNNMQAVRGLIEVTLEAISISPTFNNYLTLGGGYVLSGDFDRAKANYEKAWKLDPANAMLAKARRVYHQNVVSSAIVPITRVADSVQKLEAELKKNPEDTEILYLIARGKEKLGETGEAVALLQKALSINKYANPDIQASLARLTGQAPTTNTSPDGKPLATANPATTGAPGTAKPAEANAASASALSKIEGLLRDGKLDEADQEADKLLATNPREGKAWQFKGSIQEKKGNLDDAATDYRQAAGLGIADADSQLRQINLQRIQPLQKDADKFIAEKNLPEAASVLREITILAPSLSGPYKQLADVLKQMGDSKEAERLLNKANDLDKQK